MSNAHGEKVRLEILQAGLALWRQGGQGCVTARAVGKAVNLTHAGVLHHYESSSGLLDAIAAYAVQMRDNVVVPQLITTSHRSVAGLTGDERRALLTGVI